MSNSNKSDIGMTLDSTKTVVSEEQLKTINEMLPKYVSMDDEKNALEGLLSLEKIARTAQDALQTTKIALAIITRDFERKNFVYLLFFFLLITL